MSNIRKYFPSKELLRPLLGTIVFIGVIFLIGHFINKEKKVSNDIATLSLDDLKDKDTDGDKLPDWEEALWGTNPNKIDTDDDGISDEKEIRSTRANIEQFQPESVFPNNETTQLAQQIYTTVSSAVSQGGFSNPAQVDALSSQVAEVFIPKVLPSTFSASDLILVPLSEKSYITYKTDFIRILNAAATGGLTEEIATLSELSSFNEAGVASQINDSIIDYLSVVEALKKIQVPTFLQEPHLSVMNSFQNISLSLQLMKEVEENPVVAASGFGQYRQELISLDESLQIMNVYFTNLNSFFASR